MLVIPVLALLGAAVLAWPVAKGYRTPVPVASPAPTSRTSPRERDRRLRWVERHPDQVNTGDIRRLLAREVPRERVDLVLAKARLRRITPHTMWRWARCFGAETLVLAVAADLTHAELLAHLRSGVAPDLQTLEFFAELKGLGDVAPVTAWPERTAAPPLTAERILPPTSEVRAVKRLQKLPEITDPGGWPFGDWHVA
jgi:hypothetical protein